MKKIWIPIIAGCLIFLIPNIFYWYNIGCSITDDTAKWGQYGDFINSFLSIINIIVLFYLTYIVHTNEEERNKYNLQLEEKRHQDNIEFENNRHLNEFRYEAYKELLTLLDHITIKTCLAKEY